jgi:hypothetical protein
LNGHEGSVPRLEGTEEHALMFRAVEFLLLIFAIGILFAAPN